MATTSTHYNDSNTPGTGYQSSGGGDNWVDPSIEAQRLASEKSQQEYTAKHAMSREDFIKKYAIGPDGTFLANDKGGNSASEVAGQSVAEYYDKYLDPERKPSMQSKMVGDGDMVDVDTNQWTSDGKYRYTHPNFDAWDNVNPHPESNLSNGLGEFIKQAKPFAAMAAMGMGAAAFGGWAAPVASAATPATGLAGMVGMNAGVGATALNAGALNTGISLAQGKNIGDSLKSGVMAAALSPVGGWAKGAIGDATAGLGSGISKTLATVGAGAATGAAGAALTGQDIGKGFTNGIISGAIGAVSGEAGKLAKDATGSDLVGGVTKAAVSGVISGKKKNLATAAINGAINDFDDPMSSVNKYLGFAAA